jgi:hypothetical protein
VDVYARHLDAIHRVLREVHVVRPGSVIRELEIILYSILVLSYKQYSLRSCPLSYESESDLNCNPLSK